MSGIFGTLNTATKGLLAQQTALHTASHNISNANTEGFSRQRVQMQADLSYTLAGVGQLGTGVKMESVVRMTDDYVNKQIRNENSAYEQYNVKSQTLDQLEITLNEPSTTGINFNLNEMFNAWQELSKNPESLSAKTIVVEKSKALVETINHIANQIESLKVETNDQIDKNILDFNTTIDKIDSLNKQIFNISVKGEVPNDLLDQRDLLLKDLSSIAKVDVNYDKYGRAEINLNGEIVLNGELKNTLTKNAAGEFFVGADKIDITTGKIKGYLESIEVLDGVISQLDDFVKSMATEVNNLHKLVRDVVEPAPAGKDIFTDIDSAKSVKVNPDINNDNELILPGYTIHKGDGQRALDISKLNKKLLGDGSTITGKYNDIVTRVGISKQQSDNIVANQEVLLNQLVLKRESTSGVSIDEEVTNVLKYQKAYEANARVISVLNDMLDVLINRTGV
ncbi:flagellar hook-associated protein FlgK [Soehngenia longivitae]|uniref:Flagellar hook-associated protein 1 n=1 Tax=Soehngenia longivitae TaxID=2562294 RepID=A0A4Z0D3J9_9FIRM|nr:flagellar hook-associated protein FlgK [Soehngenia longivitae]TFZ39905.1 flagellar hook-associated protein FlgK [Soehngenia longivitae]